MRELESTSDRPSSPSSVGHPAVTLETTVARVAFVHAGREHIPVSQVLTVGTMEVFVVLEVETTRPMRACAFRHDASEFPTMVASAAWH